MSRPLQAYIRDEWGMRSLRDGTYNEPDGFVPGWGMPVFEDHFEGDEINTDIWTVRDVSTHGNLSYDWGNIQADTVSVEDSCLKIQCRERGAPVIGGDGRERWYDTGYIDTIGTEERQFGRWEFRAVIPTPKDISRGCWMGVWMRNNPAVGEIDILESWGDPPERARNANLTETTTVTMHENTNGGGSNYGVTYEHRTMPGQTPYRTSQGFHTWAIEYTTEYFKTYRDGVLCTYVTPTGDLHPLAPPQHADRDFSWVWGPTFVASPWHWRICYQMGDPYWTPAPTPSALTVMPSDFLVDYVRYWEPLS